MNTVTNIVRQIACAICSALGGCGDTPMLQKTIEELVAEQSAGMSDKELAQYWYELSQTLFSLLGKVNVPMYELPAQSWVDVARSHYPTLTDVKVADSTYRTTTLVGIAQLLARDWSNLVPYVNEIADCDDFAARLYIHLVDFYKINSAVPVWGDTSAGYHAYNLIVVVEDEQTMNPVARLIEPQSDTVFIDQGPLGKYTPKEVVKEYALVRK